MGLSSSIPQQQEGEHFAKIINPNKGSSKVGKVETSLGKKQNCIMIHPKAIILKYISSEFLWESFLSGSSSSFAMTPAEIAMILKQSVFIDEESDLEILEEEQIDSAITSYIELINTLSEIEKIKSIDFMSVCSSVLLLSSLPIENKIDQLYYWITLSEDQSFRFEEFYVALSSFEKGLSHAMGFPACSEAFMKTITHQWMALADPQHRGSVDSKTQIRKENFFDFATNRHHVVRRLLEALSVSEVGVDSTGELNEVSVSLVSSSEEDLEKGPTGGDEWMCSPAWKKTAERMTPKTAVNINLRPASSLSLEWVHGYRAFDCRNNLRYLSGEHIAFNAAGLVVSQRVIYDSDHPRSQAYFGEHSNDVIAFAVCEGLLSGPPSSSGDLLVASGEMGKNPSIHLYQWTGDSKAGLFQSLISMKGFHTKGVCQLVFSRSGNCLFSVGVDYTVAVYNTDQSSSQFGKMISSSQGPKSRVLHVCACDSDTPEEGNDFVSCGEKHVSLWKFNKPTKTYQQVNCKVGEHRNKWFLSACSGPRGTAVLGTSEGEILLLQGANLVPLVIQQNTPTSLGLVSSSKAPPTPEKGAVASSDKQSNGNVIHEKGVNALWSTPNKNKQDPHSWTILSGGKDGVIHIWNLSSSVSKFIMKKCFTVLIDGFSKSILPPFTLATSKPPRKDSPPAVRSVCLSPDGCRVLVGLQSCEVIEYQSVGGGNVDLQVSQGDPSLAFEVVRPLCHLSQPSSESITSKPSRSSNKETISSPLMVDPSLPSAHVVAHFEDELWGLAVRPTKIGSPNTEYVTVGDDGFLRVWSLQTHVQLCCVDLQGMARCCAFSPDGTYLAIGFGGCVGRSTKKRKEDGIVRVFRFTSDQDTLGDSFPQDHSSQEYFSLPRISLVTVAEIKEAKQWISDIAFSPDNTTLAVGARDNSVYFYSVLQQFKRKSKFSKHGAGITHIDFSQCGKYVQSCCSAYEILFSEVGSGAQIVNAQAKLGDSEWASWTCPLGWPVQGIWFGDMNGSDIHAVCRSPSGKLLASADSFSKVKVFRYPALQVGGSEANVYSGHSSFVTNVRWASCGNSDQKTKRKGSIYSLTDDYLISCGGNDKCIFVWKNNVEEEKESLSVLSNSLSLTPIKNPHGIDDSESNYEAPIEPPSAGDEFMAVKPWLGAIVPPTAWTRTDPAKASPFFAALGELSSSHNRLIEVSKDGNEKEEYLHLISQTSALSKTVFQRMSESGVLCSSAPDVDELELEWVHGYRGYDTRNNIFYLNNSLSADSKRPTRLILYHAAALGILLNPITGTQKFFQGHTDDIISMTLYQPSSSPSNLDDLAKGAILVATGQVGPGPTYVWEAESMRTLAVLQTKQKSVHLLSFSLDGRLLVSMAQDLSIAISDWKSQTVLVNTKGEAAETYSLAALPGVSLSFLTCGEKYIKLWTLNGRNLSSSKISLTADKAVGASLQSFRSAVCLGNDLVLVGCDDGWIYCISNRKSVTAKFDHHLTKPPAERNAMKKQTGGVLSMHFQPNVFCDSSGVGLPILITGSKDGCVVIWNARSLIESPCATLNINDVLCSFSLNSDLPIEDPIMAKFIHAISLHRVVETCEGSSLLIVVGTRSCDILEVLCPLKFTTPTPSTSTKKQVKGVGKEVGKEATVRLNRIDREIQGKMAGIITRGNCNDELWGLATHPFLPEYCTVGDDKTLRFYSVRERKLMGIVQLGEMSRCIAFSPDGSLLALGFGGRVGRGKEMGGGKVRIFSSGYPSFDPSHIDLTQLSWIKGDDSSNNLPTQEYILKLAERNDAKLWISDVKFSSDGRTLVVGAHDCKIYLYDVQVSFEGGTSGKKASSSLLFPKSVSLKLKGTFNKHNSVITHLDLSMDGRFMQSTCSGYELLFSDTLTAKQITSPSELKDVKWETWTCALGWPVQGIWAYGMDGSDINAVARSFSGHLIATADDFGKIRLFRYPCCPPATSSSSSLSAKKSLSSFLADSLSYSGHSSHIMNVRWTVADECLISCGGEDKCVFQWKHLMSDANQKMGGGGGGGGGGGSTVSSSSNHEDWELESVDHGGNIGEEEEGVEDYLSHGPTAGDESGCVKPWLGAIRPPSNPPPISAQPPTAELVLEWVHGYTSFSAGMDNVRISSNLYYNLTGDIVYPAAALGVRMFKSISEEGIEGGGRDSHTTRISSSSSSSSSKSSSASIGTEPFCQNYFKGHDDDILCLAMSPDRRFIATGQTASKTSKGRGSVIIWDALDCKLLCRMDGCHLRAVLSVSFSPDGQSLLSVGQDDNFTHILWNDTGGSWSRVVKTTEEKGDRTPVLFSKWINPLAASQGGTKGGSGGKFDFVTGGSGGMNFWKIEGAKLMKKPCRFGKRKQVPILCSANLRMKDDMKLVAGSSAGELYVFEDREISTSVDQAHSGAIICLAEGGLDCLFLVSGGKDKMVRVWNQSLQPVSSFDISKLTLVDGSVSSLDVFPDYSGSSDTSSQSNCSLNLLVGTYGGEIIELRSRGDSESLMKKLPPGKGSSSSSSAGTTDHRNLDLADAESQVLLHSHYSGELWGLATHPHDADLVATVGDDSTLRIWSLSRNRMIASKNLEWPGRSVCWHPSGLVIAVGLYERVKGGYSTSKSLGKGKAESSKANSKKATGKKNLKSNPPPSSSSGSAIKPTQETSEPKKGAVQLYSFSLQDSLDGSKIVKLIKLAEGNTSVAWIQELKFSPQTSPTDGCYLAVCSHDTKMYVYRMPDLPSLDPFGNPLGIRHRNESKYGYESNEDDLNEEDGDMFEGFDDRKAKADPTPRDKIPEIWNEWKNSLTKIVYMFDKHSSAVLHVDFTADGLYFQTNCQAGELLFGSLPDGKHITSASKLADYNNQPTEFDENQHWQTQTCHLGWSVQGIFPPGADSNDIRGVDKHTSGKILATADDFGLVKLFRFPCTQEGAKFQAYTGHSSHVTSCRWTISNHLVTVGGNDKCLFVWRLEEK